MTKSLENFGVRPHLDTWKNSKFEWVRKKMGGRENKSSARIFGVGKIQEREEKKGSVEIEKM